MNLYGKKVLLRAMEEDDLEKIRKQTNTAEFERMIVGWTLPLSAKDQKEWFQSYKNSMDTIRYIIETVEDGAVGMMGIGKIDWKNGIANDLGMRIFKNEHRSKGLATDGWMSLLRYIFDELRLNRVNASALTYNAASLRVLEKVGFKIEGTQRQAVYKNGKYHDIIMLGCVKEDYIELINKNRYWEE